MTLKSNEKFGQKLNRDFQIRPQKIDPLTCCKQIHRFLWADLETIILFLPKLFMAFQFHKINLLWNFFVHTGGEGEGEGVAADLETTN